MPLLKTLRCFLLILFSLIAETCLFAQTSLSLDSVQQIDEIVITAYTSNEIIPSQRLSGKKLELLSSHSVADAMRFFSGVQLKDYGGMGGMKTVNVRSMGSFHVGVFYDGIQVGNANNGVVDLGKFSMEDIEEISLYNGQKSEIFQSAKDFASASSIYLRTKRPKFKDGKRTNVQVSYKASSIHLVNPSIRLEQKLSDKFSLSLSSEYIYSGGEYKYEYKKNLPTGETAYHIKKKRVNSDIEAIRVEAAVFGAIANGFLETKAYYYSSDRGLPGAIVKNVFRHGDRQKDKNIFVQSSYKKDITSNYKLKVQAKYSFDYVYYAATDTVHINGEVINTKPQYRNKYYQQEVYLSAINMYKIKPWWDVSLSTDFVWNKLNANMNYNDSFAYPTRKSFYAALATSFDFDKFKAQASILGTFIKDDVKKGERNSSKSEFTPAVFLSYKPFEKADFNLRAFYKRIFRMPTFSELYYTLSLSNSVKPEYTNQYNIGFSYNKNINTDIIDGVYIQGDAYFLNVRDKIVGIMRDPFNWSLINKGKVDTKGINAATEVLGHIGRVKWSMNMNYSYTDAKDVDKSKNSTTYKQQIEYTPWHSGSCIFSTNYQSWNLSYSYMAVGKRYSGNNNSKAYALAAFHSHDFSISKAFLFKHFRLDGTVEMNNALNQFHDVVKNYPMPGRTFKFIIKIAI